MKKILLGAAALSALSLASAASAQEFSTGYVGASYSTINTGDSTSNPKTSDANIFAVRGVASFDLAKNLEVQLDGDVASVDLGIPSVNNVTVWGPTAHLFMDKDGNKAGAFLGYVDAGDSSVTAYGLEGRIAASDNISLGAVAGWGSANSKGTSYNTDLRVYRGEASYFVNDNARIDVSYSNFRTSSSVNGSHSRDTTAVFGLSGEFQPMSLPVSFTVGYERPTNSGSSYDAFSVGVRHSFGGTLKDRDRKSSPFHGVLDNNGGASGVLGAALNGADFSNNCHSVC